MLIFVKNHVMREKLQQLMTSEHLSSSRMAEMLGVQPSGISHILAGRNKPSFELLQKILRRFPRINPDWLLLDDPNMYRHDTSENSDATKNVTTKTTNELRFEPEVLQESQELNIQETSSTDPEISHVREDKISPVSQHRQRTQRVILVHDDRSFSEYFVSALH